VQRRFYFGMAATVVAVGLTLATQPLAAQRGGGAPGGPGGPGGRGAAVDPSLPTSPTAVTLPTFKEVTGPGAMYESATAQWPGRDMKHFSYETQEYFVSGTAVGQPYMTRLVIRKPANATRFSGIVVAEPMHPIGGAHAFEYNSVYIMDSGHIAAEIATAGLNNFTALNAERYKDLKVTNAQSNEILAQVGALVRSSNGPLAGQAVRKMVLWGTSASSGILTRYLPAHAVYRTPEMARIYDGFMPTSNGSQINPVDVPIIQVPTQHEFSRVATSQQDGDAPGKQFRVYEFVGLSHLMSRNNTARVKQSDCRYQMSMFPLEAYMSVALDHLIRWVDTGTVPPKADRVLIDRNEANDGSLMVLDEVGNARGGIRNPYVDVPTAKIIAGNVGTAPQSPPAAGQLPQMGPSLLCGLSAYVEPLSADQLKKRYGTPANYVKQFEAKLAEAEKAGWSLPVYHDLIVADAKAVKF
jgi:hypothetical protein